MADSNGGDGAAMGPTGEPPIQEAPAIQGDVSSTPEELNLKIEQELGLPHSEPVIPPAADEPDPAEEEVIESDTSPDETVVEEPETPVEPATPSDEELFIEVEDAEGVTHKISKIEDLPEDFVAKNNRQGYEILHQLSKLDAQIEAREVARADAEAVAAETQAQNEQFDAWDKEIEELGKSKRVDPKDQETINKVFETIAEINQARAKAGNPNILTSFEDGLEKYEAKMAREAASDKTKLENERAKFKSGLLSGSSSAGGKEYRPYVSGSARSMDDII